MRFSRFIFLSIVPVCTLLAPHPFAHAQVMTSITATTVDAGSGPVTGTLCAKAVNQYGSPISVTKSGGGMYLKDRPFCQILTGGVLAGALSVPNSVTDSAPGHAYDLVVYDTVSGIQTDLGDIYGIGGPTWSLDSYQPSYTVPTTSAFTFTTGSGAAPASCAEPAIYAQKNLSGATISICSEGVYVPTTSGGLPPGLASDGADGLAVTGQLIAGNVLAPIQPQKSYELISTFTTLAKMQPQVAGPPTQLYAMNTGDSTTNMHNAWITCQLAKRFHLAGYIGYGQGQT